MARIPTRLQALGSDSRLRRLLALQQIEGNAARDGDILRHFANANPAVIKHRMPSDVPSLLAIMRATHAFAINGVPKSSAFQPAMNRLVAISSVIASHPTTLAEYIIDNVFC